MKEELIFKTKRLFRFEKSVELPGRDTTTSDPTITTVTTTTTSEVARLQIQSIERKGQNEKNSKWID